MKGKRILIFGGSRFIGRRLVKLLITEGHQVTLANRGKTSDPFDGEVERLVVDRWNSESMQQAFTDGTSYDLVFDQLCYSPLDVSSLIQSTY